MVGRNGTNLMDDSTKELFETYHNSPTDTAIRNQLMDKYLYIVKYNAGRIHEKIPEWGPDLGDLIAPGTFGLMDALLSFDLERGVRFETYCVPRIRGAMLDELRTMDWASRLMRSNSTKLNNGAKCAQFELGRPATDEEVAGSMGLNYSQYEKLRRGATIKLVSLSKKLYETDSGNDVDEADFLEDVRSEDPTFPLRLDGFKRDLFKGLSYPEKIIMELYYYEGLTMKQIGNEHLGLSESRVSQMHSSIIKRWKKIFVETGKESSLDRKLADAS
jgi:RNA polymerase sigma factor FliA